MAAHRLLANGANTDHPVPGLPFVDDTHLGAGPPPAATAPRPTRTPDPECAGLVWIVHAHPHLGRTVLLYEAGPDGTGPWDWQSDWPLVSRAGGYWWDGTRWHRPSQLWDEAAGAFEQQPVPAAATVTAADLLDDPLADAGRGHLHRAAALTGESAAVDTAQWRHDLARWAAHRTTADGQLPPESCVVTLTAPELTGDQLIGTTALAATASISASALRAYISRGQGAVPEPQAIVAGRPMWSRPVAENWAAHRRRPAAARWPAHRDRPVLPAGAEQIRRRLDPVLFAALWDDPERRARWALRHRTPDAVRDVAADLAHLVADRLQDTPPAQALAEVLTQAALANFTAGDARSPSVDQVLGWLTQHHPHAAEQTVTAIAEQAALRFGIPRSDTTHLLRTDASAAPPAPEDPRRAAA
ncbi:hypothetical protein OG883_43755 [Streptomyces sp. NBC_01142]|uniref:hypothetical protein n=1 Tax=Streptomyces sp. NBC_01142 TaxID=2975865 RepID=UPI002253555B|nr:hypothetical protein [Streptomyces sp. NBC_01142]MCX4826557.1 hypothetical protein [Streptomyces sp. NBC_01142]